MPRLAYLLTAGGLLATAALWANRPAGEAPRPEFVMETEAANPKTDKPVNKAADQFQFVIVSDRTGGHRAGIFSRAVKQINLLQPEFVMSVGDLVEGGAISEATYRQQWEEFQGYAGELEMPFFYVPGNHDVRVKTGRKKWEEKFGRLYFDFTYKNVHFLCLNAYDLPAFRGALPIYNGGISKEQIAFVKKALARQPNPRWTLVFLHAPIWAYGDPAENGFGEVEELLKGRNYTVFCGHVHRYRKYVRQGMSYYQLATTGGGSLLRGVPYGEFDHVVRVTMKGGGPPALANVMLNSVYPETLKMPVTDEPGRRNGEGVLTRPAQGTVTLDGEPLGDVVVEFNPYPEKREEGRRYYRAYGCCDATGHFTLKTFRPGDGIVPGRYRAIVSGEPNIIQGEASENPVPRRYRNSPTSGLIYTIAPDGVYNFKIELKSTDTPE